MGKEKMNDKEQIEDIIRLYVNLGKHISNESTKLQNKLGPNGVDSGDLETMYEQFGVWVNSLGVMNDKLEEVLQNRKDSI